MGSLFKKKTLKVLKKEFTLAYESMDRYIPHNATTDNNGIIHVFDIQCLEGRNII
jgi:DNA-binding ferritin-like protein (Dps family)